MNELKFNNLEALHWLWLVVVALVIMVIGLHVQRRRLQRFASAALIGRLVPGMSVVRRYVRLVLVAAAMLLLTFSLLDPRWGKTEEEVQQQGIDILIVLDVSRSMLAEDAKPNRLERAKQYIQDLIEELGGDRVGLITAAGSGALACPLTVDYGALRLSLEQVGPQQAARGGSLLGDALRVAGSSFTDQIKDYKAVILFSDGEDHGSYPLEAARKLFEEQGIRVFTVGLGDEEEGARIPIGESGQRYLMYEGQEVWSRLDSRALREMALAAGGAYIPAGTANLDMGSIYRERIAPASKRQFGTTRIQRYHARYQWFATFALVLLLIDSLMSDRRRHSRAALEVPA